jgi:UDP-N-acetylglucosamine diphosphorylase / glucose-1-phosphate thymidylyltransferase / UDP-N-acetylgalactosamine diphosphorylase / glucosamine-1-phosphate N-acetyltransferase / galactosamine-1-phosphate N-acetyltransferase
MTRIRARLFLWEDPLARRWVPFSETRPVGELLFGVASLRARVERTVGRRAEAYLADPELEGFEEDDSPPVHSPEWLLRTREDAEPALVLSSRSVLDPIDGETRSRLEPAIQRVRAGAVLRIVVGGEEAGWMLPAGSGLPFEGPGSAEWAPPLEASETFDLPGILLPHPWVLVERNAQQLTSDLRARGAAVPPPPLPRGWNRIGADPVTFEGDVHLDPFTLLDTRDGPIHLEDGVLLRPFTHLRGPAYVGAGSQLLGGLLEAITVGPGCRLRGEISHTVILGWTNKAHEGHLGHALVGRWVNLGAGTTNSDLKSNYSAVRVPISAEREIDTRLLKVGAFIGDHAKTAIGTLLTTGTVVGAGSNLFAGGGLLPRWIPPFSWGPTPLPGGGEATHDWDRFSDAAHQVLARRGRTLTPGTVGVLHRAWKRAQGGGPRPPAPGLG